jgi:hypothetical protein
MRSQQLLHFGLNGLLQKLPGARAQYLCQRISTLCSTFKFNNVTLAHGGVSFWLIDLFGDNKSTRYAAFFQTLKHQIQL